METKYLVWHARNKDCPYYFDWETNNVFRALWWFFTLCIKYPIVNFEMRRGEVPCEKCSADWCDKSAKCKRIAEKEAAMVTCPECMGENPQECPECGGTGEISTQPRMTYDEAKARIEAAQKGAE